MPAVAVGAAAAGIAGGVAAGVTITAAGAIAFSATAFATGFAISFGSSFILGALSTALAPDAPKFDFESAGAGRTQSTRQPIVNHRFIYGQAKLGGAITFLHSTEDDEGRQFGYLYMIHTFAAHECESIDQVYLDDTLSAAEKFNGVVRITEHLGAADQTADADFIAEIPDKWTSGHRGRGRCHTASRFKFDRDAFPAGVPNVAAVIKGKRIYDPRTETTYWSDNPALCLADFMATPRKHGGLGASLDEIDTDTLNAAANVCDEPVALAAGGTESRYTLNGVIDVGQDPIKTLRQMLAAMAGFIVYTGGKWYLYAGAAQTPELTLTESDLRDDVTVTSARSRKDLYNGARATFIWAPGGWQPTDAPPVSIAAYVTEDGGEEIYRDLQYPFTVSHFTAQRLARIEVERVRRQKAIEFPCQLRGMRLKPGDAVTVQLEHLGIDGQYRLTRWAPAEDGGVDLSLEEDDADIYAWDTSMEQQLSIPGSVDSPGSGVISAPQNLVIAWGVGPSPTSFDASWDAVTEPFLLGYQKQQRPRGTSTWSDVGSVTTTASVTVNQLPARDFRVRAVTTGGSSGSWVTSSAPAAPTGLGLDPTSNAIHVLWSGGPAEIFSAPNSSNLGDATLLASAAESPYTHFVAPDGSEWFYWVRIKSGDGNLSALVGPESAMAI